MNECCLHGMEIFVTLKCLKKGIVCCILSSKKITIIMNAMTFIGDNAITFGL